MDADAFHEGGFSRFANKSRLAGICEAHVIWRRGMRHMSKTILCALVVLGAVATQTAGGASSATAWIVFSARPEGSGPGQLFRIQTTGDGIEQITKGKL